MDVLLPIMQLFLQMLPTQMSLLAKIVPPLVLASLSTRTEDSGAHLHLISTPQVWSFSGWICSRTKLSIFLLRWWRRVISFHREGVATRAVTPLSIGLSANLDVFHPSLTSTSLSIWCPQSMLCWTNWFVTFSCLSVCMHVCYVLIMDF